MTNEKLLKAESLSNQIKVTERYIDHINNLPVDYQGNLLCQVVLQIGSHVAVIELPKEKFMEIRQELLNYLESNLVSAEYAFSSL